MAGLALLDGTTAAVDFTAQTTSAGATTGSLKCHAGYLSLRAQRATNEKITFCSSSWSVPTSGIRRGFGHIDMFASVGTPHSSAFVTLLADTPLSFVFTADTGNTIAWSMMTVDEAFGVRAFGEFSRGLDFVTSGAPVIVWVVT